MKTVGVRELKNRLSEYLRHVRAGERLLVTSRGRVVAELIPRGRRTTDASVSPGLLTLAKRKLVTLSASGDARLYPALRRTRRRHRATQLLDDERGTR